MSINVKKYTKDQMAKMVEDAQAEVTALEVEITALENCIDKKNDALAKCVAEKNELRDQARDATGNAEYWQERANYAEAHPWRNLWAWVKGEAARHE